MQTLAPPLLPLLRSPAQARLLTLVLSEPGREWSLTELASRVGTSLATAQREVERAERSGVVVSHRVGNVRQVRANPSSPLTGPLSELLLRAFGPPNVVGEEFSVVAGVQGLYIFGSWAARFAGQDGRAPADIDVLVIGRPDRELLDEATERSEKRLSQPINCTVRSLDWWLHGDDGFHMDVTTRPLITIKALEVEGESL